MNQWVHFNGFTYHVRPKPHLNEFTWGAGFSAELAQKGPYLFAREGNIFLDSYYDWSGYFGYPVRRRFRLFDVGVSAFLMFKNSWEDDFPAGIFPFALPFIEFGGSTYRVRAVIVPPIKDRSEGLISFQILRRCPSRKRCLKVWPLSRSRTGLFKQRSKRRFLW